MDNTKKALKIFAALAVVFTLSSFGTLLNNTQKAQVVSAPPASTFSIFNTNATVLRAQTILKDLGMYSGRLSGLFGFKTRNAILMYQTSVQIPQTGILDIPTQNRLFAPVPPPAEYTLVENTVYGNQFLSEWVRYTYENPDDQIEIEGLLTGENNEISFGEYSNTVNHTLVSDSVEYRVQNISQNNLDNYLNQDVRMIGYVFENESDGDRPILVINYTSESISEAEYPLVEYTQDGNDELHQFVLDKHDQPGQYVNINGYFSIQSDYMSYDDASTPTRVLLMGNGNKYAIENISGSELEDFGEVNVTVRGFLLEGNNDSGFPTIVVNHISQDVGMIVVGYTTQGNIDLNNWILNVYQEQGVYSRMVGTIEDTGNNVLYAPGGNKTKIVIKTLSGIRYSVENISDDDLDEFVGQEVVIRGLLLENLNSVDLRTVVVNHIE